MSRASDDALNDLHATLATVLKEALGKDYVDEDGQKIAPPPALLNVARQFLKDNHIEAGVTAAKGPLAGLAGLPVFDDENVVPIKKANQ